MDEAVSEISSEKFDGRQSLLKARPVVVVGERRDYSNSSSLMSWMAVTSLEGPLKKGEQRLVREGSDKQKGNILVLWETYKEYEPGDEGPLPHHTRAPLYSNTRDILTPN